MYSGISGPMKDICPLKMFLKLSKIYMYVDKVTPLIKCEKMGKKHNLILLI